MEKRSESGLDFLGFSLDWEHRFEPDMPLYMQVSRGPVVLISNSPRTHPEMVKQMLADLKALENLTPEMNADQR